MDPSKRELQGPRPAPLKVRKDSHKIRKPPVPPQQQLPAPPPPQQPPTHHRPPVIIYTVSPKVIHTNPSEFMTLVQRLTGSSNTSAQSAVSSSSNNTPDNNYNKDISIHNGTSFTCSPRRGGELSGAARFAAMEKGRSPEAMWRSTAELEGVVETSGTRTGLFPGILSPGPRSLQPIPASFFSPGSDPGSLCGYFPDLSPAMMGGFVFPSPSTFHPSQIMASPNTPSVDLFNHFGDH